MVFDPTYPDIDMGVFKICDWREFYGNITEIVPGDAPKALGKMVDIRMFVDSDHAGDKLARRSRTGFFIFINGAPVMWLSKKQTTVETSVFGAEFVAMKQGMEALRDYGTSYDCWEFQSVVRPTYKATTCPLSTTRSVLNRC